MNSIEATISSIISVDTVSRVVLDKKGKKLTAITLELPTSLEVGTLCRVVFKESEVGIGKNLRGSLSFSNSLEGEIKEFDKGAVLARVVVDVADELITSVITTDAFERLELQVGDEVTLLVKATEVSLEVIK